MALLLQYCSFSPFILTKHALSSGQSVVQIWLKSSKSYISLLDKNLGMLAEGRTGWKQYTLLNYVCGGYNNKSMKNYPACKELTVWGLMYCLQSSLLIVYVVLLLSDCYDIILLYIMSSDYWLCIYLSNIFVIYCEKRNFTLWNATFQPIQDFLEVLFMFFQYKMRYLVVSKKKNP